MLIGEGAATIQGEGGVKKPGDQLVCAMQTCLRFREEYMIRHQISLIVVTLLLSTIPAGGEAIFSTFGPGDSYYYQAGRLIGGSDTMFDQGGQFFFVGGHHTDSIRSKWLYGIWTHTPRHASDPMQSSSGS